MSDAERVFVSYSHTDHEWVQEFVDELTTKGIDAWLFDKQIAVGEPIADKLENALRSSDTLVIIFGPDSLNSPAVFFELGVALGVGKRVIAVVDRGVLLADLPETIRTRRFVQKDKPKETAREVAEAMAP